MTQTPKWLLKWYNQFSGRFVYFYFPVCDSMRELSDDTAQ